MLNKFDIFLNRNLPEIDTSSHQSTQTLFHICKSPIKRFQIESFYLGQVRIIKFLEYIWRFDKMFDWFLMISTKYIQYFFQTLAISINNSLFLKIINILSILIIILKLIQHQLHINFQQI